MTSAAPPRPRLTPAQLADLRRLVAQALVHWEMVARLEAGIAGEVERVRMQYGFTPFAQQEKQHADH